MQKLNNYVYMERILDVFNTHTHAHINVGECMTNRHHKMEMCK